MQTSVTTHFLLRESLERSINNHGKKKYPKHLIERKKKMKKFCSLILLISMLSGMIIVSHAKTGDILGYAKYTDISAYINHYPITSYNINDCTAIVAEDLKNYGFNVVWSEEKRLLSITKNAEATQITPYGTIYKYSAKAGQNSFPYLQTDIVTHVNGIKVESFNINGKTCIYIDALSPYGDVVWVPETRAIKMWITDLPMTEYAELKEAIETKTDSYSSSYSNTSNSKTFGQVYNANICGTVSGTITYKYNDFRGHIGDTGAHIILIPIDVNTKNHDNAPAAMGIPGTYDSGIRVAKVDGSGNYTFNYVPVGNYFMIVVSKETTSSRFFNSENEVESELRNLGLKYFNESDLDSFILFTKMQKYTTHNVKVTENYNYVFSYDFGTTYI